MISLSTVSLSPVTPPAEPDPTTDPNTVTISANDPVGYVNNALSGIDAQISAAMDEAQTGNNPTAMITLEDLVAQRQQIVTMAANIAASLEQTLLSEVQNIGRQ